MIVLKNSQLTAHLMPLGASLAGLWYGGGANSLVLGSPRSAAYKGRLPYFGAIVGPVANRIREATVTIDGIPWHMQANEKTTCLHSGPDGVHARRWVIATQDAHHVTFALDLPHGAAGLPGNRHLVVRYGLADDATLTLDMSGTSDRDTLMNLAHHPYWTLDTTGTIAGHRLQVFANTYLPTDAQTLPTGKIVKVSGSNYDFRKPSHLTTDRTLDASLCLARERRVVPQLAANLTGATGRHLRITTTEPGLQVYNGSGLAPADVELHSGQILRPFAGVALEPQGWPDAPHHDDFPSILLPAGSTYCQQTRYQIS